MKLTNFLLSSFKQLETIGNNWKQLETIGNNWKLNRFYL
jgi:hypothetical protein